MTHTGTASQEAGSQRGQVRDSQALDLEMVKEKTKGKW